MKSIDKLNEEEIKGNEVKGGGSAESLGVGAFDEAVWLDPNQAAIVLPENSANESFNVLNAEGENMPQQSLENIDTPSPAETYKLYK